MDHRPPQCPSNAPIAAHLLRKRSDLAAAGVLSDNFDQTLTTAHRNICNHKSPINSLKDLSQIKGVGKWIIRLMKDFFPNSDTEPSPTKKTTKTGKAGKGPRRYAPQKNSVAYALLITLYRQMRDGAEFMKKQELIDAAEASGLSRTAIGPDKSKGKGKPSQVSSARDWYTGWNCMKTLILKGLVAKSSCPAKYMLTQEGQEAARECILKSGLVDSTESSIQAEKSQDLLDERRARRIDFSNVDNRVASPTADVSYDMEINETDRNLQFDPVDSSGSDSVVFVELDSHAALAACTSANKDLVADNGISFSCALRNQDSLHTDSAMASFSLRACSSLDASLPKPSEGDRLEGEGSLAMPPCRDGEKFEETYELILILDDREKMGSRSKKVVDNLHTQFKVLVEVRRLPVGDGIWVARHRESNKEFVLDYIVERKNVHDLCSSIRDNRYRDQKMRLQRCGFRKLIYLVEGDLNSLETSESLKTACFTTEILEGFDVQRTTGFADTVRRYGHLTQSIFMYCCTYFPSNKRSCSRVCPSFVEFVKKCQDLEKLTVSDVLALQLMQVPQVTEGVALAVVHLYPTILSLARAYASLEGDARGQEEMLKNQSTVVSGVASKNIFKLVWG